MTTTNSTEGAGLVRVGINPDGIPGPLKTYSHWVAWEAVPKKAGRLDKILCNPRTGEHASTTDSRTWGTFPEALAAYEAGGYGGIGFVLSSGDPYVVVDFDGCRNASSGEVDDVVLEHIRRFKTAYIEISPSGTGLHVITGGKLREGKKKGTREVYGQERFITITGEVFNA